jgi:predicted dehydrogenase
MTQEITRRDFIRRTAAATAGAGLAFSAVGAPQKALGANDKLRVGVIGTGRMGRGNLEDFARQPDVEIVTVSDVFGPNLEAGVKSSNGKATTCKDFREILDRKDIDAVIVATPDHWHALMTVEACKAGKDVYVEKPISTTVEEGRRMVEAARKYHRVVQVGTQQRSGIHFQKAVEAIQQGMIGKISFVRTWNYDNSYPKGIGNPPDSEPPADLDWDAWLGPAPKVAFNTNRFGVGDRWSTFRYFWDYAGGYMTDWGVHLMDIVQWALKVDGPDVITASGGKFYIQDNAETPDTLEVTYEYPGFICTYENRWDNGNSMYGKNYGIEFHGTDGTMFVDRGGFKLYPEKRRADGKYVDRTASMEMPSVNNEHFDHVRNFVDCVKSRQRPVSDIEIGHRSTSVCLLGNVALRSKQRIVWDSAKQELTVGDTSAKELLGRQYRAPWKLAV